MRNKSGIISALVLSLAVAGSAFAGVGTPKNNKPRPAAVAGAKTQNEKMKPKKHHKHRKAKHAKMSKSAKTATPSMSKSAKTATPPTNK